MRRAVIALLALLALAPDGRAADSDWQAGAGADWQRELGLARQEGKVVVAGQVGAPAEPITAAFHRDTGLDVDYLTGSVADVSGRIDREAASGNVTLDVAIGGGQELISLMPKGLLAPLKPQLLLPTVADGKYWAGGHLKWMDNAGTYMLQTTEYVSGWPVVNADLVPPHSITSWDDFLKPEYKGKIASYDPRSPGPGQALATYLAATLGIDYVKKLFLEQNITFTRDGRQLVEWAARGTHPIALAAIQADIERFRKEGVTSVVPLDLLDAPGNVLGGFSVVKQLKGVPHPHAATVFINWIASRPGQEVWSRSMLEPSRRIDVHVGEVPAYVMPKPGVKYLDQYTEDFYVRMRPKLQAAVTSALGGP